MGSVIDRDCAGQLIYRRQGGEVLARVSCLIVEPILPSSGLIILLHCMDPDRSQIKQFTSMLSLLYT